MSYIQKNFLLTCPAAQRLYFDYAADMPVFDYHCHLSERMILDNAEIGDIYEVWLAGDHYKWRLMRNYGVDEAYITGDKSHREKFIKYCETLGTAFGNPLYHWSQIELEVFFRCEWEINGRNAARIWDECNAYIKAHHLTPRMLIEQSRVACLFTTNEVFDDLSVFARIAERGYAFRVAPAFRADRIMNMEAADYTVYMDKLAALTHSVTGIDELEDALAQRLKAFMAAGCRAADIALECVYPPATKSQADAALRKRLSGGEPDPTDIRQFKSYLTYYLMKLYAENGIVTELHLGAMRNNNTVMRDRLGPDTGYDSMSDTNSATALSRLLDMLNGEGALPRLILFNLNPKMNTELMTLMGCFQDATARGKLQYGAAWWFLDNKVGMEKHLEDLTATGHIAAFVGMLTDSRSLLSYPRHGYFRRILCNYLGSMMENGLITSDMTLVGEVVRNICYNNAVSFFGMEDELAGSGI